ncbi:MAG TPA: hypothetical protein VJR89_37370, partial [Polyangiales bacterium]|nr:hypothetical protein [Polyangiales bacterium]
MNVAVVSFAVVCACSACVALLYRGRGYLAGLLAAFGVLAGAASLRLAAAAALVPFALAIACTAVVFGLPALRRRLVTRQLMRWLGSRYPEFRESERVALDAGTVWWDAQLFSGAPDWKLLFDFDVRELSAEERAFLRGPVEKLCAMLDEWQIEQAGDLPSEAWEFLKRHGFFGMIIPREY